MKIRRFSDFIDKWVEFTLRTGDTYESYFIGEDNDCYIFCDNTEGVDYAYLVRRDHLVMMEATSKDNEEEETTPQRIPTVVVGAQDLNGMQISSNVNSVYKNKYRDI